MAIPMRLHRVAVRASWRHISAIHLCSALTAPCSKDLWSSDELLLNEASQVHQNIISPHLKHDVVSTKKNGVTKCGVKGHIHLSNRRAASLRDSSLLATILQEQACKALFQLPSEDLKDRFLGGLQHAWQQSLYELLTTPFKEHPNRRRRIFPQGNNSIRLVPNKLFSTAFYTRRLLSLFCGLYPHPVTDWSSFSIITGDLCRKILSEDSSNLVALTLLAVIHEQRGNEAEVEQCLQKVKMLTSSSAQGINRSDDFLQSGLRNRIVADLSMVYYHKRYEIHQYPDFIWYLHNIRTNPEFEQDKDLQGFVDFHYGFFVYRVVDMERWRNRSVFEEEVCRGLISPTELMESAHEALEAASTRNQGYSGHSLINLALLNKCLYRHDAQARPILTDGEMEELLKRAEKCAQKENDAQTLGRIGRLVFSMEGTNRQRADSILRKSLEVGVTVVALTTLISLQQRLWIQEYLHHNPDVVERERIRLSSPEADLGSLSQKLSCICFTPHDMNLSDATREQFHTLLGRFSHVSGPYNKKAMCSHSIQLSYLLGVTTLQDVNAEFTEALKKTKTERQKGWMYLRWSGCFRGLSTEQYHPSYRKLLWKAVRNLPQCTARSLAGTSLLHVISSEGAHAEEGSDVLNKYFCDMAEVYLLMGAFVEARVLLQKAIAMYEGDVKLVELMDRCQVESTELRQT